MAAIPTPGSPLQPLRAKAQRFWRWWSGELLALVPQRFTALAGAGRRGAPWGMASCAGVWWCLAVRGAASAMRGRCECRVGRCHLVAVGAYNRRRVVVEWGVRAPNGEDRDAEEA